jgi:hypothetical protein
MTGGVRRVGLFGGLSDRRIPPRGNRACQPVVRCAVRLAKPRRAAAGCKAASSQRLTVAADSLYFFYRGHFSQWATY